MTYWGKMALRSTSAPPLPPALRRKELHQRPLLIPRVHSPNHVHAHKRSKTKLLHDFHPLSLTAASFEPGRASQHALVGSFSKAVLANQANAAPSRGTETNSDRPGMGRKVEQEMKDKNFPNICLCERERVRG